jgi:hypothetical protein
VAFNRPLRRPGEPLSEFASSQAQCKVHGYKVPARSSMPRNLSTLMPYLCSDFIAPQEVRSVAEGSQQSHSELLPIPGVPSALSGVDVMVPLFTTCWCMSFMLVVAGSLSSHAVKYSA